MKEEYADVETILEQVIDEIWDEFDEDRGGTLDMDETRRFVRTTLMEMGESPEYREEDLLACFK